MRDRVEVEAARYAAIDAPKAECPHLLRLHLPTEGDPSRPWTVKYAQVAVPCHVRFKHTAHVSPDGSRVWK